MVTNARQLPLKMSATMAAADTNCTAVALTALPAVFVSFQRQPASLPLTKNVHSAVPPALPAVQFSGNNAQIAAIAATTASFATF
jgi:hypothetical protein